MRRWGGLLNCALGRLSNLPKVTRPMSKGVRTGTLSQKRQPPLFHSKARKPARGPYFPSAHPENRRRGEAGSLPQPPAGSFYGGRNPATLAVPSRVGLQSSAAWEVGRRPHPHPHSPSLSQFPLSQGPQLREARPPPPSGQEDKQGWNSTVQDGMSSGQAGLRPLPPPAKREFMGAPPWLLQY